MFKMMGILLIIAAVFLAAISNESVHEIIEWKKASHSQKFSILIEKDFEKLLAAKKLPKEWLSISKVEYSLNSELAKKLLKDSQPKFIHSQNTPITLELEIFDLPDDKRPGIIIQASLLKNKNKIHEVGRNYYLDELNK